MDNGQELFDIEKLRSMEKPPLTFEFKDKDMEPIKMTYGLEMDLRRLLPDPVTTLQAIHTDTFTQDYVIRRCLTKVNKIVTDPSMLIPVEDVTLDSEEVDALLMWAAGHAMYFFVKRTAGVGDLGVRMENVLPNRQQMPLPIGSETSASTMPSAGDSTQSKETSTASTGPTPDERSNSESS